MTDKKISELTSNGTLTGSELVELVQSGSNVKALLSAIKTWVINGLSTTTALTNGLLANLTPTINTQTGASYTLQTADNDGKTYLRMTNASANTVEIPSTLTLPVSISQRGTGTTTLVAGSGVTLNGTLAFTAQHQTKTVIPLGSVVYDVVG